MRLRALVNLTFWIAGLSALFAFLVHAKTYGLALPPLHLTAWKAWLRTDDPTTVVFALTRVGALIGVTYLLASTAFMSVAVVVRIKPVLAVATLLAASPVRRMLQSAAGLSVVGILSTPALAGATPAMTPADNVPVLIHVAPGESLPDAETPITTTTTTVVPSTTITQLQPPQVTSPSDGPPTAIHVVVAGDNLWTISKQALASDLGRTPTESEVSAYWHRVVETNRVRLLAHSNPDLIFPGQIIELPSTAA